MIIMIFDIKNLIITVTRKGNFLCWWPGSCPESFVSGMSTQDQIPLMAISVLGNPTITKELVPRGAI